MHLKFQEWSNWEIGHFWTKEILKWKKWKKKNIQKSELSAYLQQIKIFCFPKVDAVNCKLGIFDLFFLPAEK